MAKKMIAVWLSLAVLLTSTITIYAEEEILTGQFMNRPIDINGARIENHTLSHPLFLHQGTAYVPLSGELGEVLGFTVELDEESRTLTLTEQEPVTDRPTDRSLKNNLENPVVTIVENLAIQVEGTKYRKRPGLPVTLQGISATAADIDIGGQLAAMRGLDEAQYAVPAVVRETLELKDAPVLFADGIYYLPLRALTDDPVFGWNILYDDYSGLYISTDPAIPANAYFDRAESDYNRGLSQYILARNPALTLDQATRLVFLFRHEAAVSEVDEILLMAMAQKESTFRSDAVGGTAIGLMQITTGTAARYGIAPEDLYDPHVNIEFGARYIGDKLDYYDSKIIALTAYNAGGLAISRGTYTTRYAGRVTDAETSIREFLVSRGYGLGSGY